MNVPAKKIKTVFDLIDKNKVQFARALPNQLPIDRFLRVAMTSIRGNWKLQKCEPGSLVSAIMQAAQLGLEIEDVLGQAYLVPYKDKAQFQVGYRGFITLAMRTGKIEDIVARVVYEKDYFEYEYGTNEHLIHKPTYDEDRGDIKASYCCVTLVNGRKTFEVLTKMDIDKVRAQSKASEDGPWVTHYEEMAKKSAVRKKAKYLDLSPLQRAAVLDEYIDAGINPAEPPVLEISKIDEAKIKEFDGKIPATTDRKLLDKYLNEVADGNECSVDTIKEHASGNIEGFIKAFEAWASKGKKTIKKKKEEEDIKTKQIAEQKEELPSFDPVNNIEHYNSLPPLEQADVLKELIDITGYDMSKMKKGLFEMDKKERSDLYTVLQAKREAQGNV